MGELLRRLNYLLHFRRHARELEDEMMHHRERMGKNARHFGNTLALRENAREAWGWTWIERLFQDIAYAVRILRRSPGFTFTAVLVLTIGIGVNIAAFSLFDMVALKPLPVPDPDSLVQLQRRSPTRSTTEMPLPQIEFYRDHARTLAAVISIMGVPPVMLDNDPQSAHLSFVSTNYFTEIGIQPALGRLLDPTLDGTLASAPVVVLTSTFWKQRLNADPEVIGRVLHLNGKAVTVAGVLPSSFISLGNNSADLWMAIPQQPYLIEGSRLLTDPGAGSTRMFARLAHGVTPKAAEQEMLTLTAQMRSVYPNDVWENQFLVSIPAGHPQIMLPDVIQVESMISVLMLLILAVACANLGGLLLARGITREHEIGIRIAIGASKQRILRQLFTESLVLSLLGSFIGLIVSIVCLHILLVLTEAPPSFTAIPDWRVLTFAFSIAFLAAIFFGLTPALQIARQKHRKPIARQFLVAAQVAASCVLLIVAGLLVRAMQHILYNSPGFAYQSVVSVDPQLGQHGYKPAAAGVYLTQLESRLRAQPGVLSVSLVKFPPMGRSVARTGTEIQGKHLTIYPNSVDPSYFQTMNMPILLGRTFQPGDQHVTIISESLARRINHGDNPIGKPIPSDDPVTGPRDIVIGIVGNARINALGDTDATEQYWPVGPDEMPHVSLVVQAAGPASNLSPAIKSISQSLDPKLFPEIRSLESLFGEQVKVVERLAATVSLIGLVAISLAGIGIIGLVSYTASQRAKEIAIRLALGAPRLAVLRAILSQFALPVALGLLTGIGLAAAASSSLRRALYGISNLDPLSYAAATLLLLLIIAVATVLPARRALRIDIAKALHNE